MALAKTNDEPEPAAWIKSTASVCRCSLSPWSRPSEWRSIHWQAFERWRPRTKKTGDLLHRQRVGRHFWKRVCSWASKYPHRWFGPMLGLYSGARVNEVAQLQVDDIATVDGVPGFYVRVVARGQRIKGKHSRRFIPLAQPVLEAGFLDYVQRPRPQAMCSCSPIYRTAPVWDLAGSCRASSPPTSSGKASRKRGRAFTVFATPWPIASTPRVRRQRP